MNRIEELYDFNSKNERGKKNKYQVENKKITPQKLVLVTIELPNDRRWRILESLAELKKLAESAGFKVVKRFINKRTRISPSYLIGKGTIEKISLYCESDNIHTVLFDNELSPAQTKNISKKLPDIFVKDRTSIILDIFAMRAQTKEGKLQVQLAQLQYMLPRLTRQWQHLIHQEGGTGGTVGVRGPGEKQLEMDRRQIRKKIHTIKKELKDVEKYRSVQRKKRKRHNVPVIALIGYTNSGKSTLLNRLTNANAFVENKLFATLDPTTRRLTLPNNQDIILIDTVGFISKLPHQLVDAFKATLEELKQADLLIHVLDVSDDNFDDRKKIVFQVLHELKVDDKKIITVNNKIDIMSSIAALKRLEHDNTPCVSISAKTGKGIESLFCILSRETGSYRFHGNFFIPLDKHNLITKIYENGIVKKRKDCTDGTYIEAECNAAIKNTIEKYFIKSFDA
ncbi:GTPase HflX [bacterium]|nr:GTPase HflX [bacterium]